MDLKHIPHAQGAIVHGQVYQGDVHLAHLEQLHRIRGGAVGDLQLHLRVFGMELFQVGQQEKLAKGVAGADHQAAGLEGAHTVELVLGGGDQADGLIRIAVEHPAFAGEGDAPAGASKQGAAQGILQPVHGLAYGRLADIKLTGSVGKAAAAGYRTENTV